MSWHSGNSKIASHTCPLPPVIFHSTKRVTPRAKWQCPQCFKVYQSRKEFWWKDGAESKYYREHKVSDKDYWYYIELQES